MLRMASLRIKTGYIEMMIKKAVRRIPQLDYAIYLLQNTERIVSDYVNMRSGNPKLKNIMVELTNACNLKCYMCNTKDAKREKGYMAMDVYNRIVEEAVRLKARSLILHTVGESLMHPALIEMIKVAKSKDLNVRLSSNGVLLNSSLAEAIVESGLDQFRFSIEGATRQTYERIRRGANFDDLLNNMKIFKDVRDKRGKKPNIVIGSIVMKETEGEIGEFYKRFSALADSIEFGYLGNQGGQAQAAFNISATANRYKHKGKRRPCKLLWSTSAVLWNGDISCCCVDFDGKLVVGNIMNDSLSAVWTSKEYNYFRMLHKNSRQNEMPMCGDCSATEDFTNEYKKYKLNRNLRRIFERA
jgi:radical SAM protein with 4Fe4S-binding SPASM domain